ARRRPGAGHHPRWDLAALRVRRRRVGQEGRQDRAGRTRAGAQAPQGRRGVTAAGYKKLINDPFDAVDEALEGFVAAHAEIVAFAEPRVVARRRPGADKVGLVVGGGSGHEPAFAGYVGPGLADAAACGNIFASPPPNVVLAAIHAASFGRGVLMSYGNY